MIKPIPGATSSVDYINLVWREIELNLFNFNPYQVNIIADGSIIGDWYSSLPDENNAYNYFSGGSFIGFTLCNGNRRRNSGIISIIMQTFAGTNKNQGTIIYSYSSDEITWYLQDSVQVGDYFTTGSGFQMNLNINYKWCAFG